MVASKGYRKGTRHLFKKDFRKKGVPVVSTYLRKFNIGDYVDIRGNPSCQKGMPYKYYHGRTGRVWNITPRAVGVDITRVVRGKAMLKRLYLRTEHVFPSKSTIKQTKKKIRTPRAKPLIVSKKTQKIEEISVQPFVYLI